GLCLRVTVWCASAIERFDAGVSQVAHPPENYLRGLREDARVNVAEEFDGICRAERARRLGRTLCGASSFQSS
ncbi:hypothetical protein, partial [Pandoraea apista]|uniref:hypothetical protein n=1 Tax=Pandoraea apista TaxID=93218 RepID=UPI001C8BACE6